MVFLPMILVLGFMWLFLIRPQKKQQKQHSMLINELKVNDKIETIGGIIGVITILNDTTITIKTAGSVMEINKYAVKTKKEA